MCYVDGEEEKVLTTRYIYVFKCPVLELEGEEENVQTTRKICGFKYPVVGLWEG